MSATLSFIAGLLAGAAAVLGAALYRRASRVAIGRNRKRLLAGGVAAGVILIFAISLAIRVQRGAMASPAEPVASDSPSAAMPPPAAMPLVSAMPSASMMSRILATRGGVRTQTAEPMDQAAAGLAARLERQGGTAADWTLLAQAYDFLGRAQDAQRARARAAEAGANQRTR